MDKICYISGKINLVELQIQSKRGDQNKKKSTDHPFQIATYRLESFLSFFIEED